MVFCARCNDKKVTAIELKKKCRYHKDRRGGQTYDCDSIAPKGLCLDAFHVAYPYCLALLYDAEFAESCHREKERGNVVIQCPIGDMKMEVKRVQTLPKPIKFAKTSIEWLFKNIYPLARVDYKIRLKILEAKGKCYQKAHEEYWMNIWDLNELCPASFDAIYPFLNVSDKNKILKHIHCPDHKGILYEFEVEE